MGDGKKRGMNMADEKNILKLGGERRIGVAREQGHFRPRPAAAVFSAFLAVASIFGCGGAVKPEPTTFADKAPAATEVEKQKPKAEEQQDVEIISCSAGKSESYETVFNGVVHQWAESPLLGVVSDPAQKDVLELADKLKRKDMEGRTLDACLIGKIADTHPELDYSSAVPELIKLLEDKNQELRNEAVKALGAMGDISALPILIKEGNAAAVGKILEKNPGYKESTVSSLIAGLGKGSDEKRARAVAMLIQIGDVRAGEPIESYLKGYYDEYSMYGNHLRNAARFSGFIGHFLSGLSEKQVPILVQMLRYEGQSNVLARDFLGKIGSPAVPALIEALKSRGGNAAVLAAYLLGEIGDAKAVLPLIGALKSGDSELREAAAESLGKMKDARAVPVLIDAFDNSDIFGNVPKALASIGEPAVSALAEMLEKGDLEGRARAARIFEMLPHLIPFSTLMVAFRDEDGGIRGMAARALGGRGDAKVVPLLLEALNDRDARARAGAVSGLGSLESVEAVPALIAACSDDDSRVKHLSILVVGEIARRNPKNKEIVDAIVPTLKNALGDGKYPGVRHNAALELGGISNALEETLKNEKDESVAESLRESLERIGNERSPPGGRGG